MGTDNPTRPLKWQGAESNMLGPANLLTADTDTDDLTAAFTIDAAVGAGLKFPGCQLLLTAGGAREKLPTWCGAEVCPV